MIYTKKMYKKQPTELLFSHAENKNKTPTAAAKDILHSFLSKFLSINFKLIGWWGSGHI